MEKAKSTFNPDFCAVTLKDNPWIVQPFEKYEEIRIEELKKNKKKGARILFKPLLVLKNLN